jgi:hypothetical protein
LAFVFKKSKCFFQTSLLQNGIGCMSRFDFAVDRESKVGDGGVPNIVVPFAMSFKMAPTRDQQPN